MPQSETKRWRVRAVPLPGGTTEQDLWIDGDRVVAGPLDDATVLEAGFVAPGLVDCHGHLSMPFQECLGHRLDENFVTGEQSRAPDLITDNLALQLRAGVTAVRDAGYVRQRELIDQQLPARPQVIRSGWIVVPEGRYFPGSDIGKNTSSDELVDRVREAAEAGMRWFKVIADFPGPDLDLFAAPLTYPIETLATTSSAPSAPAAASRPSSTATPPQCTRSRRTSGRSIRPSGTRSKNCAPATWTGPSPGTPTATASNPGLTGPRHWPRCATDG